jgi:hypothetical protein
VVPNGETIEAFVGRGEDDACKKWAHEYLQSVCPYRTGDYRRTYPNGGFSLEESTGEDGRRIVRIVVQRDKLAQPGPEHVKIVLDDGSIFAWRWPNDTLIEEAEAQLRVLIDPNVEDARLSYPADPTLHAINQLAFISEPVFLFKQQSVSVTYDGQEITALIPQGEGVGSLKDAVLEEIRKTTPETSIEVTDLEITTTATPIVAFFPPSISVSL